MDKPSPELSRLAKIYAERRHEVVFWVGAGLSQPARLPSWLQLIQRLEADARSKLDFQTGADADELDEQLSSPRYQQSSPWKKIDLLYKIIGKASYNALIEEEIGRKVPTVEIPQNYFDLWKMRYVERVVTLNLDNFLSRSHRRVRPDQDGIVSFSGTEFRKFSYILGEKRPFILNLHGLLDDKSTWILRHYNLNRIISRREYKSFIEGIFRQYCIVFIGISIDDEASGGFLQRLSAANIDTGQHFWITNKTNRAAHEWSQDAGIQSIIYKTIKKVDREDHVQPISQILSYIEGFTSEEAPASVVIGRGSRRDDVSAPDELAREEPNTIRRSLNSRAIALKQELTASEFENAYSKICEDYRRAIHNAFYVGENPPDNKFFNYTIKKEVSNTSYSNVFEAEDNNHKRVAIKILDIKNLTSGPDIQSFRRGVASLKYLTNEDVDGVIDFRDAYEMPPTVITTFSDGVALNHVVGWPAYKFSTIGLNLINKISTALLNSHYTKHGVLHRDLRPSNVLVENFYFSEDDDPNITLINFDMSWHKNATGSTIRGSSESLGYYAPEQLESANSTPSRNFSVDVYGLGMLLYYLVSKEHPPYSGGVTQGWGDIVAEKCMGLSGEYVWKSVRNKIARLIIHCTRRKPEDRPVLSDVILVLEHIDSIRKGESQYISVEYFCEELLSRCTEGYYEWNDALCLGSYSFRKGRTLYVSGSGDKEFGTARFESLSLGDEKWGQTVDRLWVGKRENARDILQSSGWKVEAISGNKQNSVLSVSKASDEFKANFPRLSASFTKAVGELRID